MPRPPQRQRTRARRQMDGLTEPQAQAICDDLDAHHGYPLKGAIGGGRFAARDHAWCDEWLAIFAAHRLTMTNAGALAATFADWLVDHPDHVRSGGDVFPAGITLRWAKPIEKHDEPGNFAVPVDEHHGHETRLRGRTLGGRLVMPTDFRPLRIREEWKRPAEAAAP